MTDGAPVYRMERTATESEIDELGHVSNLVYVRWIVEVAGAHSTAVGYDWDAYRALGGVWVVRRHEIDYLRPAYAGDHIALETWVESFKAASSIRLTTATRGDEVVARGRTQWAFVDIERGRPRRIPAELAAAFTTPR